MVGTRKKPSLDAYSGETEVEEIKLQPPVKWHEEDEMMHIEVDNSISDLFDLDKVSKLVVLDYGRCATKAVIAGLIDGKLTLVSLRLTSHLTEINEENLVDQEDFFAAPAEVSSSDLSFVSTNEHGQTVTYAFGERAATIGGKVGLGESKTVGMAQRTIGALIGVGRTDGDVILGAQIIFAGGSQWKTDKGQADHALKGALLKFTAFNQSHNVNVLSEGLLVAPEDFYSEYFAWKVKYDSKMNELPCWKGLIRLIVGIGFQTINVSVVQKNNAFDPIRSRSINLGTSTFYQECAILFGGRTNFEDPEFIDFINMICTLPIESHPPSEKPYNVPSSGKKFAFGTILSHCNTARNKFLGLMFHALELDQNENESSVDPSSIGTLFSNICRFMVTGGGAHLFGEQLIEKAKKYESFICPFPEGASSVGQFLAMAEKK